MWPCLLLALALLGAVPVSSSALASPVVEDDNVTQLEVPEEYSGCLGSSDMQAPGVPSMPGTTTCRYIVIPHCQTFHQAQCICAHHYRGHLVSIHNSYSNTILRQLACQKTNSGQVWIGAVCQSVASCTRCHWTDRSPWNYWQWECGQPQTGCRLCTALCTRTGRWRSVNCNRRLPFICQI